MVENGRDHCKYELNILGRDIETLKKYTKLPYARITYDKAIEMLQDSGKFPDLKWGVDFGSHSRIVQ